MAKPTRTDNERLEHEAVNLMARLGAHLHTWTLVSSNEKEMAKWTRDREAIEREIAQMAVRVHKAKMMTPHALIVRGGEGEPATLRCPYCEKVGRVEVLYTVDMFCPIKISETGGKPSIRIQYEIADSGDPNDNDTLVCRDCGETFDPPSGVTMIPNEEA